MNFRVGMFVKSAVSDHVKNLITAVGCKILTESFGHVVTNCQWYFQNNIDYTVFCYFTCEVQFALIQDNEACASPR